MNDQTIKRIIAYYRLSRKKKGMTKEETEQFAYGIEAQKLDVERLRAIHGAVVVDEYIEIETGTNKKNRPKLDKAIGHAKSVGATLVIAKLDRLARNVRFISTLIEERVDFVCCDNPKANTTTLQLYSVLAEDEARRTSERTKAGLVVAKSKGKKLGSARPGHWDGREHLRGWKKANKASVVARQKKAQSLYGFLIDDIMELRKTCSIEETCKRLNDKGHRTTRGNPFAPSSLFRIIESYQSAA